VATDVICTDADEADPVVVAGAGGGPLQFGDANRSGNVLRLRQDVLSWLHCPPPTV